MQNITQEKFKKAIRDKYESERNGKNFEFLNKPSPAKLRDLCWDLFMSGKSKDDLNVFSSFFGCEFSPENKKKVFDQTDKFRPIGFFYKGKTADTNYAALDMAAILVDYELRPFNKFRTIGTTAIKEQVKEVEVKQEEIKEEEIKKEVEEVVLDSAQEMNNFFTSKPANHTTENQQGIVSVQQTDIIGKRLPKKMKYALVFAALLFVSGIIYFALPQKHCMQWSEDHYELVDCDLKVEGFAASNPVELLDESLINLKKIKVCDTTQYFDKNGNAVIWYAKTANGIDFFDGHGRHPESNNSLRPVTQYIINKYVKKP
ncbi:hypothetical protein [Flavobacterium hungaricum]|uniref:Uncharacterized protein n=1 Tax=Flavobacterium hungaricum TaxID=2082725 RepID=A0ABR9TQ30_9FLAO|nr:hypothetical protein [Flavobacterium hungaricum]MBE8726879.1 hypothetical protein [Flavobacterium hungaricum]